MKDTQESRETWNSSYPYILFSIWLFPKYNLSIGFLKIIAEHFLISSWWINEMSKIQIGRTIFNTPFILLWFQHMNSISLVSYYDYVIFMGDNNSIYEQHSGILKPYQQLGFFAWTSNSSEQEPQSLPS